jgi:drug/metabolite transporter (DMT)-like permease
VVLVSTLCALGAMTVFGIAAVLQAVATARTGDVGVLDPRLVLRLLRQPLFLAALTLNLVGFGLHVAALQALPLFLVQAVIAGAVAVTALLSVRVFGRRLTGQEWGAVGLIVVALVLLASSADDEHAAVSSAVTATAPALIALLATGARRVPGPTGAVLLGLLAGSGFGVVAICARLLPELGPALLTAPVAYVLAVAGTVAFVVYSGAMQRGSATTATAAMVVTQTVVPAVAGLLLGDRVRPGSAPFAAAGFVLALLGAVGLGRYEGAMLETAEITERAKEEAA